MKQLKLLVAALLLTGCEESYISVHTDYLSHENLASYIIRTPDPLLNNPPIGQRLIIGWSVPRCYMGIDDLHLNITIRFRNRTQVVGDVAITQRKGTYIYEVLNGDYYATRGILTYKVDLVGDGIVLEEWRHQIWTELITVESTDKPSEIKKDPSDTEVESPPQETSTNFYEDFE